MTGWHVFIPFLKAIGWVFLVVAVGVAILASLVFLLNLRDTK